MAPLSTSTFPRSGGLGRGLAFVRFKLAKEVEFLIQSKHEIVISGKKATIVWARKASSPRQEGGNPGVRVVSSRETSGNQMVTASWISSHLSGEGFPVWVSSHSYREALVDRTKGSESSQQTHVVSKDSVTRRTIKFSYVERSTKAWMERSVVGRRQDSCDVVLLQQLIEGNKAEVQVFPIGASYCYIFFYDAQANEAY